MPPLEINLPNYANAIVSTDEFLQSVAAEPDEAQAAGLKRSHPMTDKRRGHCVCGGAPASPSSLAIGRNELLTMVVIAFLVFYGNSL